MVSRWTASYDRIEPVQDFLGVMRIWAKHAAVLLVIGAPLHLATHHSGAQDTPKRPRITGVDHVRLYVTDIEKSREFYSKLIGVRSNGGMCFDDSRPCFTVGWGRNQTIELEKAPASGVKNWVAEIAFATDNVDQMRGYLVSRGVAASKISKDTAKHDAKPYAAHFELRDPEGNAISFIQRLALPVDDPPPGVQSDVRLLHAGFMVKDRDAENKFYLDLLGFKLYWYGGFKDNGVDWYEVQVPDGPDWIEYMLNIPANADKKELGVQNHFSLGVRDASAAAAQLRKNGLLKFDGPEVGRDGKNSLDAYDPDGTRVEVMEFTPTQKPCCNPYTAPHPTP
jgi:catechol 2,3-dioxygenase-like lactoylglutathione lyase family enzyme